MRLLASSPVVVLSTALVLLGGCDSPAGSGSFPVAAMNVVSGDQQRDTVGRELAEPLVVRVLGEQGQPLNRQIVNFVVTEGGGAVFAGAALTNERGEARERWTLGTIAGDTQRVEVRAVDAATGESRVYATFTAVGVPDSAQRVLPVSGGGQLGEVARPLEDSLVARVVDQYGNAVEGVTVVWTATGGGTVSPTSSTSGVEGIVRTEWSLGPSVDSAQTVTVGGESLQGATFDVTAEVAGALAFASDRDGGWDIYWMRPDGTGVRRVTTHPSADRHPTWSPDGRRIAYSNDRSGSARLYLVNSDGSDSHEVGLPAGLRATWPAWSPDGAWIAFVGELAEGVPGVYVVRPDGTELRRLSPDSVHQDGPAWAPDSRRLLVVQREDDPAMSTVLIVESDGTGEDVTVLDDDDLYRHLDWSPDGSKFATLRAVDHQNSPIPVVLSMSGEHIPYGSMYLAESGRVSWAPDSERIAFSRAAYSHQNGGGAPEGSWQIFIRLPQPFGEVRETMLTRSANNTDVAWRP